MNLMSLLLGSMTNASSLNALSGKTGISDKSLSKLITAAIPILLKFMTKNAGAEGGAQSLLTALGGHKDTRSMAEQIKGADAEDGTKILGHILGNDEEDVINSLAKETDLDQAQVTSALSNISPALMSGVSAATNSAAKVDLSDGLDLSDLMGMFGGNAPAQASSGGGLLDGLLGGGGGLLGGGGGGGLLGGGLLGGLGGLLGGGAQKEDESNTAQDGADLLGMLTSLMK